MAWFKFGKAKAQQPSSPASEATCLHAALLPRWDRAEDIGHEDRATGFQCDSCKETFTPEEGRQMRDAEAERLRKLLQPE